MWGRNKGSGFVCEAVMCEAVMCGEGTGVSWVMRKAITRLKPFWFEPKPWTIMALQQVLAEADVQFMLDMLFSGSLFTQERNRPGRKPKLY